MIKKLILLTLIITIVQMEVFAFSYTSIGEQASYDLGNLGILKAEVFEDTGEITRYEVLKTIMIVVCGNDNSDYGGEDALIGLYNDFDTNLEELLEKGKFLYEYSNDSNNHISLAFYNDIAKGVCIEGKTFFLFENRATIAETITFMVRCLTGKSVTMEEAHTYAKEVGLLKEREIYYQAYLNTCQDINFDYFCILLERFVNQKRYMYIDGDSENFPKASIDLEGTMTYKEYLMQNIAKDGMCTQTNPNIIFTPEMASKVADMVFKAEFGDYFAATYSELTIDEFEGMYKITRKRLPPSESTGATIYINKYNGAVMDFVKE